jgi:tetratricopeptide (TPR) repeat protein
MNIIIISYIIGVASSLLMGAAPANFEQTSLNAEEQSEIVQLQADIQDEPEDVENHLRMGQIHFKHNNLDESGKALETAKILEPHNPDVLAWWGSIQTKRGGATFPWLWGFRKIALVKEGVEAIDEAVRKAPDNPVIRLIRINTLVGLKGRFSNFETVFEDERYFTDLSPKQHQIIPDGIWAQIDLALAKAYSWKAGQKQKNHAEQRTKANKYLVLAEQNSELGDEELRKEIFEIRKSLQNTKTTD